LNDTDDRSAQVPYAPYRIETSASGGRVVHPATGKLYNLNRHAVNLLDLCDGWHTLEEIVTHISGASGFPTDEVKSTINPLMARMTQDGLVWCRRERVRHFRVPPPQVVYFDVTMRCNLRCAHCGVDAGEPLENELSTDECINIIDQLAHAGVSSVGFSGGEPLLRQDLMVLAAHAKASGMFVELSTNATLVTPGIATRLRDVVDHVQVSLDGSTPEIHDAFRGRKGAFKQAAHGIGQLRDVGVPFVIGCVVHKKNLYDLQAVAAVASSLGAESLRLIHFVPFGRGRESPGLEPSPSDLYELARRAREIRSRGTIEISEVNFEFLFSSPEPLSKDTFTGPINCGGGWSSLTITPQGEVLPCSFFAGMRGDSIRERPFVDIWDNSRLLNYWRSLRVAEIGGKCTGCQWLAVCKGGCPAANFAHGKMLLPNVQCFLTPEEATTGVPLGQDATGQRTHR
jgi:radical SAM protein with 4Fe4S-binding SPASM domain